MEGKTCSSQNNGCVECGVPLIIWQLGSSVPMSMVGRYCDGEWTWDSTISIKSDWQFSQTLCQEGGGNGSQVIVSNAQTKKYMDEYGDVYFLNEGTYSCTSNTTDYDRLPENPTVNCGESTRTNIKGTCPPTSVTTTIENISCEGDQCSIMNRIPDECTSSSTCKELITTCSFTAEPQPCPCCETCGDFDPNCHEGEDGTDTHDETYNYIERHFNNKMLIDFYNYATESATAKIIILEQNKIQNCDGDNCGQHKDDCWGFAGGFTIADNNLDDPSATNTIHQKWKFKISTSINKKEFSKIYKTISGKVYFYIASESEPDTTPCCTDCGGPECFTGTIVRSVGYSLSSSGETFKIQELIASGVLTSFDNNDQSRVGQVISSCYTIDSVELM